MKILTFKIKKGNIDLPNKMPYKNCLIGKTDNILLSENTRTAI